MRSLPAALVLAAALTFAAPCADAQRDASTPGVGSRVRVTEEGGRVVGRVAAVGPDTLFLRAGGGGLLAVPEAGIRRVEVSWGVDRWRGARRGARIGAVAGGVAAGIATYLNDPNCEFCFRGGPDGDYLAGAFFGALFGGSAGAVVGAVVGVERWEVVPHARGGLSVGVRVR